MLDVDSVLVPMHGFLGLLIGFLSDGFVDRLFVGRQWDIYRPEG